MDYKPNDIVTMVDEFYNPGIFDWTVREKKWDGERWIYFLTRPGYEGWFTNGFIAKHSVKE